MPQDKIKDDVLARIVRNRHPEFYKDWSDDAIVRNTLAKYPKLQNKVRLRTAGEKNYDRIGSAAAPNFGERIARQTSQMLDSARVGLIGMTSADAQVGENARKMAEEVYRAEIYANPDLQALTAWKEDEAGWTSLDTTMRSLSEAIPSLALSIGGAAAAALLGPVIGTSALVAGAFTMLPLGIMEGTGIYNDMMKDLTENQGLDAEEAQDYAYLGAAIYTPMSMMFEYLGGKAFAKLGGIGTKAFDEGLKSSLNKSLIKKGWNNKRIAEVGARGTTVIANGLGTVMSEGSTEYAQSVTNQVISKGIASNVGKDGLGVLEATQKAFQESWLDKQTLEEGYAGASTGMLAIFGLKNKVSRNLIFSNVSSEDISEMNEAAPTITNSIEELSNLKKSELIQAARDEGIKGYSGLKKSQILDLIINKRAEEAESQTIIEEESPSVDTESSDVDARYLDALIETDSMQEVLDEASTLDSKESNSVSAASGIKGVGNKILRMILEDSSIVDKIKNSKNKIELLNFAKEEYNKLIDLNPKISKRDKSILKLGNKESDIIQGLKEFNQRGSVKEIDYNEQDISEDGQSYFDFDGSIETEIRVDDNTMEEGQPIEEDPSTFTFEGGFEAESSTTKDSAPEIKKSKNLTATERYQFIANKIANKEKLTEKEEVIKNANFDKIEPILKDIQEDKQVGTIVEDDNVIGENIISKDSEINVEKKLKVGDKVKIDDDFFAESKIKNEKGRGFSINDSLRKKIRQVAEKGAEFEVINVNKKSYQLKDKKTGEKIYINRTFKNKSNKAMPILSKLSDKKDDIPLPYTNISKKELESYTVKDLIAIIDEKRLTPISKNKKDLINQILENDVENKRLVKVISKAMDTKPQESIKIFNDYID